MGPDRWFLQPLWTDFKVGRDAGILDWYTVLVGTTAVLAIAEYGALLIVLRTAGRVRDRARALVRPLWAGTAAFTVAMSAATLIVQPRVAEVLVREPWRLAFTIGAVAALVAAPLAHRSGRDRFAFASWSGFLALLLASAAFGLYPWLLPSSIDPRYTLSIAEASAAEPSLRIGAVWWPIGIGLALAYTGYVHWRFWGRAGA